MTTDLRVHEGIWGTITELPPMDPHEGLPQQVSTLQHWFLDSPPAHPLWPHYTLAIVHLRPVPGESRPAALHFPDSSHELMLLALNPDYAPWTAENVIEKSRSEERPNGSIFLMPQNYVQQLRAITDDQARELCNLVAQGLVHGTIPIEKDDWGGSARWREVIGATLEHIVTGGHAVRSNN